jgi:arylsulfatase A
MPERPLFWHYPHYSNQGGGPSGAIRVGDYKLIEWFEDHRVELFNLKEDLGERNDLATKMPERAADLARQLHAWQKSVDASFPTPNPGYKPAR